MTSKEIQDILSQENGKLKLYKICERHFQLVDKWEKELIYGGILDEYELCECMQKMTGVIMKLNPIAGALESYKEYIFQNNLISEQSKFEKLRVQDNDVAKANARGKSEEIGDICSDFRHYFYAAQACVVMTQSRLKRLTIEKSAKGIDITGERPIE